MMRTNFYFIFLFIIIGFFSCKTNNNNSDVITEIDVDIPKVDINNLSKYHQYTQHLVIKVPEKLQSNFDSLAIWVVKNQPGGLILDNWELHNIKKLVIQLDSQAIIKPFIIDDFWNRMESRPYDYALANSALNHIKYTQFLNHAGVNMINFNNWPIKTESNQTIGINYSVSSKRLQANKISIKKIKKSSHNVFIDAENLKYINVTRYRKKYQLNGLLISTTTNTNKSLSFGADMIVQNGFAVNFENFESDDNFEKSTTRILSLKQKIKQDSLSKSPKSLLKFSQLNFQQKATALIFNKNRLLPSTKIKEYKLRKISQKSIETLNKQTSPKYIILPDTLKPEDFRLINKLNESKYVVVCFSNPNYYPYLKKSNHLVFIPPLKKLNSNILKQQLSGHLSFEANFIYNQNVIQGVKIKSTQLANTPAEFVGIDSEKLNGINYMVQSAINGKAFPGCQVIGAKNGCVFYNKSFGHHTYKKQIAVNQNSIYDIASLTKIVSTTLMAMKLYELNLFKLNDSLEVFLPDSLTKTIGRPSTLRHITFQELLTHKSGLPAGFPIIKYLRYTNSNTGRFDKFFCDSKDDTYDIEVAKGFYLEKAYKDSMWLTLNQIWLNDLKPYKYSDVNMNTLYFILKSIIHNKPRLFGFSGSKKSFKNKDLYVNYLYKTFYKSIGMTSTFYNPTKQVNINRIVPTERESYWRKQLLQGYVHDPNAALYGGVAGNAGVFTNTNDLVMLLQMLLNNGVYNNKEYLKAETIQKFIATQPNSHRGLGFNKRTITNSAYAMADSASVNSYGHTGFTGTCFWVDPDSEIVYVFLANRVHPKVSNKIYQYGIRKNIHQVFYDALLD